MMLEYYYEIYIDGERIDGYIEVPKGSTHEEIMQEIKNKSGLSINYTLSCFGEVAE